MTNNTLRILTSLVAIPVVLGILYIGGWPFAILGVVAALVAQFELYGLMIAGDIRPIVPIGLIIGALVAFSTMLPWMLLIAFAGLLLLIMSIPFLKSDNSPLIDISATIFGVAYPIGFLATVILIRNSNKLANMDAFLLTACLFLLIWITDTFAYFTGRSFGKHKLAPSVSPKKTWEGAIGGALGALVTALVMKLTLLQFISWIDAVVLALICGVISQVGDLAESRLKRSVGVKDSGNILPGHGGMLDRLDAMIAAMPFAFLYLVYIARII